MRKIFFSVAVTALVGLLASCNKEEVSINSVDESTPVVTKSYGDKTPKIAVYVETNDVNPLNAGDYYLSDGSQFVDIVELFAANIHADDNGDPSLYFNDKLVNVLENLSGDGGVDTYVKPLQDKGIKVILTTLGDWQNIGVANMTDTQAQMFAEILAYVVNRYDLDGIGFDDEYSGTSATISGSYGNVISKLHDLLDDDKLITVFEYGNYSQISSAAGALIDYAYTDFEYWNGSSSISGVSNDRWAPIAFNLGYSYNAIYRSRMKSYAANVASGDYGAIMFFNLRPTSDVDSTPVFTAIGEGAYGLGVTVSGGDRDRTAGSYEEGLTITYDEI